jgi:hypothetical protein
MNLSASISYQAESLSDFITAIQTVQAMGIAPSAIVTATRAAPPTKAKHPLEVLYNEKTGGKFTVSGADCKAVGWEGTRGEMPEALRLSAIAGRLVGMGIPIEEVQSVIESGGAGEEESKGEEIPEIEIDEAAGF